MTAYDAVLFDNDGVLVEPPDVSDKVEAARAAFAEFAVDDVADEHIEAVISGVTPETLGSVCETYDLEVEDFWEARERHDERVQLDRFRAGSRGCYGDIGALASISVPCAVVSNNHHTTIEFILEHFGLADHFAVSLGREMTVESLERKKPNTHYVDRALADLGAESALVVGDRELDVVAAHRAGLDSAFLRRSHCADVDLDVAPTYEVDSLHDVVALVDG